MSLRVWLPLTKDLRNQGLDDVTVTNNGATFNSEGKLGGCYSFGGSPQKIVNTLPSTVTSSVGSLSCWVKMNSLPGSSSFYNLIQLGNLGGYATCRLGLYMEYTNKINISIDGSSTGANVYTHSLVANQWYHICATYDGTIVKLYIDGNEVLSKTASKGSYTTAASYLYVGGTSSYYLNGYMNDARYYDHCLSEMEVKQLSQGLILHYPLNHNGLGNANLFDAHDWTINTSAISIQNDYTLKVNQTAYIENYNQYDLPSIHGEMTISFNYETLSLSNASAVVYMRTSKGGVVRLPLTSVGFKQRLSLQIPSDATYIQFSSWGYSGVVLVSDIKLEEGERATSWCPREESIEYDTSGYCNNGTRTGTFSWTSDTPKYAVSQYFNGSSYILTDSGTFSWFDFNTCTIAAWFKPTITPGNYTGTIGISHDQNAGHKSFCIGNYGGKFTVCTADGSYVNTQSVTLPINEWHYCVATLDGTTVKMYVDGELVKTYTLSWGNTGLATDTRFQVGIDLPGSDEKYKGYYSDIRAYATALSADDVKSLYQNCATIDPDGTIRGQIRS